MIFFVYVLAKNTTTDFSLCILCSALDSVHSINPCNPPASAVAVVIYARRKYDGVCKTSISGPSTSMTVPGVLSSSFCYHRTDKTWVTNNWGV